MSARATICPSRHINADEIEPAVWDHVAALLADPNQLLAQFEHFAATADAGSVREQAAEQQLRTRLDRTARADKRLLDAYQAGAVSLPELSERRQHLAAERQAVERQQEEQARLRQQRLQTDVVRASLTAFCERIRTRLHDATLSEKQAILQLVIERIIVGEGRLEIRHVIPLRSPSPGSSGPMLPKATRLRSDGVDGRILDLIATVIEYCKRPGEPEPGHPTTGRCEWWPPLRQFLCEGARRAARRCAAVSNVEYGRTCCSIGSCDARGHAARRPRPDRQT